MNFLYRYPRTATLAISVAVLAMFLLLLEFGFRAMRDLLRGGTLATRTEIVSDPVLGWALNTDRQRTESLNACGEPVLRGAPASRYLNRVPTSPTGTRVLFLGDSHTHAHVVSSGAAYYDYFEKLASGRAAVWASGVGGFSTTQEYLLLRTVYNQVKPDLVVWQLTGNDVGENVYTGTDTSTVQRPRPYVDAASGKIEMRNPSFWLLEYSELAKIIYREIAKIDRQYDLGLLAAIAAWLRPRTLDPQMVETTGLQVMERTLRQAMQDFPRSRFAGFAADSLYERQYREIFTRAGATFLDSIPEQIRAAGGRTDCAPLDGHWNHRGSQVVAKLLSERLAPMIAAGPVGPPR